MNHTSFPRSLHREILLFSMILALCMSLIIVPHAYAQGRSPSIIRDTEIEMILKKWATPVIKGAALNPEHINFILVQDPNINAFVAGGPNIFLFTGLLTRSESPAEIVGVIAHELGHIRGGHLVRLQGAMANASYESLLGTILGIGAAVLTGESGVAAAIIAGSQSTAFNRFLAFSRVQEASADQAALDYLEKANLNPEGLLSFMKKLEDQELLPASQQSQYIRTHPLTRDRISALEAGKQRSAFRDQGYPNEWEEEHRRLIAKLIGFITPEQVSWKYDDRDKSTAAEYARAIASYRKNNVQEALNKMDNLLKKEPKNPFFLELKGQMLVDFGRVEQALPFYKQSIDIVPESALIRTAYAHALIESAHSDKSRLSSAINHLKRAVKDEPRSTRNHRLLATAYGRLDQPAMAKLHLAEEALLKGEIPYAKRQVKAALNGLEEQSNSWLRAKDILNFIEQNTENN